jgi:group I intron endonuclease
MIYGHIYKITNQINNKEYIGQSTQEIEKRFKQHCVDKRNRHISNAIRKHGKENFVIIIIASAENQEQLNDLEQHHVITSKTMYPNGYNHRAGGNQNGICSDKLKQKISDAKTGKPILKRRGEVRSQKQRLQISRGLGGKSILASNVNTGETKVYLTAHSTRLDGHNPSNVVQICKKSSLSRTQSKGWKFEYIEVQDNQSGSTTGNTDEHAQRLGIETASAE